MEETTTPLLSAEMSRLARWKVVLGRRCGPDSALSRLIRGHRLLFSAILIATIAAVAHTGAFAICFGLPPASQARQPWLVWWLSTLGLMVLLRLLTFLLFGLHRHSWRHACPRDMLPLTGAVALGSALFAATVAARGYADFPHSVIVVDALLCLVLLAGARYAYSLCEELLASLGAGQRRKAIVVGAGAAGQLTIRAMFTRGLTDLWPVALLDDDPLKQGTQVLGVPVVGPVDLVLDVARRSGAEAIVLAVPTASSSQLYRIVRLCRAARLPLKTIPDIGQILRSSRVVTRITDFRLEDLLNRRPVRADVPELRDFLRGRVVLVTGAAGSIGSELCRQIAEQQADLLVCLDKDENGLFRLEHELSARGGTTRLAFFLGDVKERGRMEELFGAYRPEIVYHAAAYKHVPVLQYHPTEAIRNNVGGTLNLAELAQSHGVGTFVMISTDKAVNPTSVMGATKRVAEHVVRARSRHSATRFCAIRFGNVLGSNGSVVELFLRQIREGRPVTVTHPHIERYFMTIAEAVHLVLFAGTMARGGETFILDMGDPVNVDQLARQIIQMSGLVPDVDVPIVYTGLRPGEKLTEELWTSHERPAPTAHQGILVAPRGGFQVENLDEQVACLLAAAEAGDLDACWSRLLALVPTFQGHTNGRATVPPEVPSPVPAEAAAGQNG